MTRLPNSPLQECEDKRRDQLAQYLSSLSESRQVMFLNALKSDPLRLDIQDRIRIIKKQDRFPNRYVY